MSTLKAVKSAQFVPSTADFYLNRFTKAGHKQLKQVCFLVLRQSRQDAPRASNPEAETSGRTIEFHSAGHSTELDPSQRQWLISAKTSAVNSVELTNTWQLLAHALTPIAGRSFKPVPEVMPSFQSPQVPQQSNRQRFKARGKQFKKCSNSSSSGTVSSGGSGSGGGVTYGQCGGRHMTSQCRGVQGLCHNCGQLGYFTRVCPAGGQSLSRSQQGSTGGSSQRSQPFAQTQRSGFQPREPSREQNTVVLSAGQMIRALVCLRELLQAGSKTLRFERWSDVALQRKSAMVSCPESFRCQLWSTVLIDEFSSDQDLRSTLAGHDDTSF
ncbi:hypothetical protein F511_39582 [Dorcoceras hygrometricum]|uniref:CCHC-type domain-containing protein n=1 Tax=Dorcoceras hygrometricum TaxID=472368 RepID=A0A2Z7B7U5_9LAMI|nr:hypothetical protein F511_39582 [Dorcoceras hygrometricum]